MSSSGFGLALSMFSIVPLRRRRRTGEASSDPGTVLTAVTAGRVLLWLPLIGAVLACVAGLVGAAALQPHRSALLAAVISVAVLALLSGGLHLDGLADTVDGLGSRAPAERALQIMRAGDIGPFGVLAIVVVVLLQAAALTALFAESAGSGWTALVLAAVTGRSAALTAAVPGIPAARPGGFGALVVGSVGRRAAGFVVVAVLLLGTGFALLGGHPVLWPAGQLVALLGGHLVQIQSVRRLGGVTGDVFGAVITTVETLSLVAFGLLG